MKNENIEMLLDLYDQVAAFELGLLKLYGAVIYGHDLHHVMGYPSAAAFRLAVKRKTVPVPTFKRPGYRMRFARTRDIAKWLVTMGKELECEIEEEKENDVT